MSVSTDKTNLSANFQSEHNGPIAAPRNMWMVALLNWASFGIYPAFWMYARARDMKVLRFSDLSPWLWFLSPFFAISLPFSIQALLDNYTEIASERNISTWPRWTGGLGVLLLALGAAIGLQNSYEFPGWVFFLTLASWSVLFAYPQQKINEIHSATTNVHFRNKPNRFNLLEWFLIFLGTPFVTYAVGIGVFSDISRYTEEHVSGAYPIPNTYVTVYLPQNGWTRVKKEGQMSSDDAVVEFNGPLADQWLVVYKYGLTSDLDFLVEDRIYVFEEELGEDTCEEKLRYAGEEKFATIEIFCQGESVGNPVIYFSKYIETKLGYIELIGRLSSMPQSFRTQKPKMIDILNSFQARQ